MFPSRPAFTRLKQHARSTANICEPLADIWPLVVRSTPNPGQVPAPSTTPPVAPHPDSRARPETAREFSEPAHLQPFAPFPFWPPKSPLRRCMANPGLTASPNLPSASQALEARTHPNHTLTVNLPVDHYIRATATPVCGTVADRGHGLRERGP